GRGGPPPPRGSSGIRRTQPTPNASNSYPPSPLRSSGDSSYLEELRQQAQRRAQQTQRQQPLTATPAQEVYGPYVPYIPPTSYVPATSGYTPRPEPVQLGDN